MKRILIALVLVAVATMGLQPARTSAAPGDNLIANASLETAETSSKPAGWVKNKWGTNTATFSYLTTGHTGSRSVKAQVKTYSDGDAKWYFTPVAVTAGSAYTFSDFYKSNITTEVVVEYTHQDASLSYQWVGSAAPSTAWAQADFTFTVPNSVTKATVLHVVPGVGWLTLDDASLKEVINPLPTPGTNLLANPSVEAGDSTVPANWLSNKWGNNTTTFSYLTTGHTGNRSVKVQTTAYTDGDAKWFAEPVNVTPGKTYKYTDYYQSNVPTDVFAWFIGTDGSNSYQWLGTAPADSAWHQADFSFQIPATAQKVAIFHALSSVGWLVVDDASLTESTPVPVNPVPNRSVEQVSLGNPDMPNQWHTNKWGTNTALFEYLNEGYDGNRSVKVTVSNYVDGDAKWYFEPQALQSNGKYRFSVRYKTNTEPRVATMYTRADGTVFFGGMPNLLPSGNTAEWQLFSDTFTVPSDAVSTSVFLYVAGNGWVQTDDYSLETYVPTGFNRPLVSLTFDDGEEDNVTTAMPTMNSFGLKSTQCFATDHIEGNEENIQRVLAFKNSGHEICSHTVNHPFLTQVTPQQLTYELTHSKEVLETLIGGPVRNFATPYGDYNAAVVNGIMQQYRSHRTVDEGYNSKDNFDIRRIRVQNMLSGTTIQQYQQWLDTAKATNTWLVLVYHRVTPTNPGPYDTLKSDFDAQMQALINSGITVKTYNGALDEIAAQL